MGIGLDVALQLKASEMNFSVVLFITLYEVVITFFYNIFLVEFELYEVTVTLRIKLTFEYLTWSSSIMLLPCRAPATAECILFWMYYVFVCESHLEPFNNAPIVPWKVHHRVPADLAVTQPLPSVFHHQLGPSEQGLYLALKVCWDCNPTIPR